MHGYRKSRFTYFLLLIGFLLCGVISEGRANLNFTHLENLTEKIEFKGHPVAVVHVYSHFPSYSWVEAEQTGKEGTACVDDVARAAVMYLRHFEITNNFQSLKKARLFLQFVLDMQATQGTFFNFIHRDGSVNTNGDTSRALFGCWSARAVWALGLGARLFADNDPVFASKLSKAVKRIYPHIDLILQNYLKIKMESGKAFPTWLMQESCTDITSELLLGLCEIYRKEPTFQLKEYLEKLGHGIALMQVSDESLFPYGIHLSGPGIAHLWGNCQTQALATLARLLKNNDFLGSAEKEARGLFTHLIIGGWVKEIRFKPTIKIFKFDQIAYGIRPVVVGLIRMYEATHKPVYLKMAGLASGWFFGNNVTGKPVYDASTGRCYDAITGKNNINLNSGAESTIEALMTLVECEKYPLISGYMSFRKTSKGRFHNYTYAFFKNASGQEVVLIALPHSPFVSIFEDEKVNEFKRLIRKYKIE